MAVRIATSERISPRKGMPDSWRRRRRSELAETAVPSKSGMAISAASQTRIRTAQGRFSRTLHTSLSAASSILMRGTAEITRAAKPTPPATRAEASVRMPRSVARVLSASPGESRRRTRCSMRRSKLSSPSSRSRISPTTASGTREKMLM